MPVPRAANSSFPGTSRERMKGLEPSTFCMAISIRARATGAFSLQMQSVSREAAWTGPPEYARISVGSPDQFRTRHDPPDERIERPHCGGARHPRWVDTAHVQCRSLPTAWWRLFAGVNSPRLVRSDIVPSCSRRDACGRACKPLRVWGPGRSPRRGRPQEQEDRSAPEPQARRVRARRARVRRRHAPRPALRPPMRVKAVTPRVYEVPP